MGSLDWNSADVVTLGSVEAVTSVLNRLPQAGDWVAIRSFYAYAPDRTLADAEFRRFFAEDPEVKVEPASTDAVRICVSRDHCGMAGPMAGLEVTLPLHPQDRVLTIGLPTEGKPTPSTIIAAGQGSVFVRFERKGHIVYFCTSSRMIDINQPMSQRFYDIKEHFCSVVPLIMFIKQMFPDTAWHPQELGACLIIDDPLLKSRYGHCDFPKMRDLMRRHKFTTNIAFIPWNWRRTSRSAGAFFRSEADLFSVSIHGCDHTAREFGSSSLSSLQRGAQLAQSRMRKHFQRTGVRHDSIMVFPQGVFSSDCPGILQRNGFLAAVNTEVAPVDSENARTRICDVWDIAIMAYDGFSIFTRRYAFHGIENFAFDLMLGKPCLIVAHQDSFRDGGAELIALVERINSLNCTVKWQPLGEVIRRACRHRMLAPDVEELEMYGNELLVENSTDRPVRLSVRKRKSEDSPISGITCNGQSVTWTNRDNHHSFEMQLQPLSQERIRTLYEQSLPEAAGRSLQFELAVAARRILSEFRDEYLSTNRFLSAPAHHFSKVLRTQ